MKKGMQYLSSSIAIMAMMGGFGHRRSRFEEEEFKTKEIKKIIPKGCKEFTYKGITVTSLSEKRAKFKIEKILKYNYLLDNAS